jgi:hypothetical protein
MPHARQLLAASGEREREKLIVLAPLARTPSVVNAAFYRDP